MPERFWFVYYWLIILYLCLTLWTWASYSFNYKDIELGKDYWKAKPYMLKLVRHFLFNFIYEWTLRCDIAKSVNDEKPEFFADDVKWWEEKNLDMYRSASLDNIYPFLLVLLMTGIRFIFTGKHIWQRP